VREKPFRGSEIQGSTDQEKDENLLILPLNACKN